MPLEELIELVETLCTRARSLADENVRLKQQLAELMEEAERLKRECRTAGQRLAVLRDQRSRLRLRVRRIREHVKALEDLSPGVQGQAS